MLKDANVVLAYNSDYDQRILKQSAVRHGLEMPQVNWQCVMKHYAQLRRLAQWVKLDAAARTEGVRSTKPAHRALSDCRTTLKLFAEGMALKHKLEKWDGSLVFPSAYVNRSD